MLLPLPGGGEIMGQITVDYVKHDIDFALGLLTIGVTGTNDPLCYESILMRAARATLEGLKINIEKQEAKKDSR